MSNAKNVLAMSGLYKVLKQISEELDRDATLLQVMAFVRVAMVGEGGFDPSSLGSELSVSSATITRTAQRLTERGVTGGGAGYGVAKIDFDPNNRSRRVVTLTPDGERAVAKIAATLARLQ